MLQSSPVVKGYGALPVLSKSPNQPPTSAADAANAHVKPAQASLFSRLLFNYANPLMQLGNERQLNENDLWELDDENQSATAFAYYHAEYQRTGGRVVRAMWNCYWPAFMLIAATTSLGVAVTLFAPIVLNRVINAFAGPQIDAGDLAIWLGVFFVSRIFHAVVVTQMSFYAEVVAMRVTVALKSLLFHKVTRRSIQSKTSDATAVDVANLYSTDVMNILWAAFSVNSIWILPIQIGVAVYMLYDLIGVAAFAGLGVIVLSMIFGVVVATISHTAFESIMARKDDRMKAIKEVFGAIQIVKLNAWESKFAAKIGTLRATELEAVARFMYSQALQLFALWASPVFVSVVSFTVYAVVMGQPLTAEKVFTSIALFNVIRDPLRELPGIISFVIQSRVSFARIAKFLELQEYNASNVTRHDPKQPSDVVITVQDGSFGWTRDAPPVLKNVNLQVKKGDLVVVHGVVGIGKSTLCAALLGETEKLSGSVFVRGDSVAYYSQQPWIQNMTIRDNILFGSAFDERRYAKVLDACGLVPDLAGFPGGDATEIGQKGVNLSGGQKARVCLARACYSEADVLILDSPLAAVDAVVQSEIFAKCICGLLEHKTVVLVTHNPEIIASEAANYKILVADGVLSGERRDVVESRSSFAPKLSPREVKAAHEHETEESKAALADAGRLVDDEEREKGRVARHVFLEYFNALGGIRVGLFLFAVQTLWQCFQISSDLWLSRWTARKIDPEAIKDETASTMTVYALLGAGAALMVLVRTLTVTVFGIRASRRLFDAMTRSLLHAPLRFFDANPIGRIVNRYGDDTSTVDFVLPFTCGTLLALSFFTVCQLATAMYMVNFLSVLIVPLVVVYIKVGSFFLAPSREISRLSKVSTSPVLSHLTQSEEGVALLRAFGPKYLARVSRESFARIDASNVVWLVETVANMWFQVRMQLIGSGVVIVIVSGLVYLHERLSPGVIGLVFTYALSVDSQMAFVVDTWSRLEIQMVSPERILEYAGIAHEGSEKTLLVVEPEAQWPQTGVIVFESVVFTYKPGAPAVLKGLSFAIRSNEKVGIVGRTGAGKSSLTMALFRINELESGRIVIDGEDISSIPLQTLRSRLSIIPQAPVLFKGSLRAYMDPFDEYSDAAIWAALAKVEMKDQIGALDKQLAFELSENGDNLSVGERQMMCMARALLTQTRIVVMDEATASIDHATEKKLQKMIAREFQDATVLTIAHRLATVLDSDRILVLSDGRVAEFDAPRKLVQDPNGAFYQLAKEGGYLEQLC